MREAHKQSVAEGLNESHFDVIVELLAETLNELGAQPAHISEVATIANSIKDDILNR